MSIHTLKKLVVVALVGWGSYAAVQRPLIAGGQIVPVADPAGEGCNACGPTCCQSFCRKLRLHGVYARRSCSQKYVLLPNSQPAAPCPPPNAGVPPYANPYGQQTIGGYNPPPMFPAPAGVYIR